MHPIRANLSAPLSPASLPPNLDVVVYSASPSGSSEEAYRNVYVKGPLNLLSALAPQRGLHRLIFVSSTGVYAQGGGEGVDEESPAEPESESGKRLLEGEGLVLGSPMPAIVLRLGGIYGPGRSGTIQRVLNRASGGEDQHRYINRIHCDDCVTSSSSKALTTSTWASTTNPPPIVPLPTGSLPASVRRSHLRGVIPRETRPAPLPASAAATPASSPPATASSILPSARASLRCCPRHPTRPDVLPSSTRVTVSQSRIGGYGKVWTDRR
jgi:NAD dependent epimerase/dehydratase family